jgi:hypothetical protein
MALVDDIEFYGRAVAAAEMDRGTAVTKLVESAAGSLTTVGAQLLIDDWQAARQLFVQEGDRAADALDRIGRGMGQ